MVEPWLARLRFLLRYVRRWTGDRMLLMLTEFRLIGLKMVNEIRNCLNESSPFRLSRLEVMQTSQHLLNKRRVHLGLLCLDWPFRFCRF